MAFKKIERTISVDLRGVFTLISLASTIGIYINSTRLTSPYLGVIFTIIYFLINSIFTGNIFFDDENTYFRVILGLFALVMLIAIGGTAVIVASALIPIHFKVTTTTALLALITIVLSFLKHTRVTKKLFKEEKDITIV